MAKYSINGERVNQRLQRLAEFVDPAYPGWTRRSFTPIYREARHWLYEEMIAAGLFPRWDTAANLIGELPGVGPAIVVGSHTDTVPGGGRFDGTVGVVAAIEVAETLREHNVQLRHPLWVIDFLAEEPSIYGLSTIGSRAAAGRLSPEMLDYRAPDGTTLREGIALMGGDPSKIHDANLSGRIDHYLELHVEQGPVLADEEVSLGIVSGVVGILRYRLRVVGVEGHAGTMPMAKRHDALVAASELITAINDWAYARSGHVVATFGTVDVKPNALNVIPGEASLGLELRSLEEQIFEDARRFIAERIRLTSARWGVHVEWMELSYEPPTHFSAELRNQMEEALARGGYSYRHLPSWAGHDAVQMHRICPASGMLFIPSAGGVSHCPEEWSKEEWVTTGAQALLDAVVALDQAVLAYPSTHSG
ncbi:MAG: Zn-dependent hydrolase [Firmicutes bacterium]|nr:Zn-dependent hydrolase [Bacillota bacterium]